MVARRRCRTYSADATTAASRIPSRNFFPGLIASLYNCATFPRATSYKFLKAESCPPFVQECSLQELKPNSKMALIAAALLLAFMAVLAGGAAHRESITIDETAHTGAGVSYWQ